MTVKQYFHLCYVHVPLKQLSYLHLRTVLFFTKNFQESSVINNIHELPAGINTEKNNGSVEGID